MAQYGKKNCQRNSAYKRNKRTKHKIISLDSEKAFDKIQQLFMKKILERSRIQGANLNII